VDASGAFGCAKLWFPARRDARAFERTSGCASRACEERAAFGEADPSELRRSRRGTRDGVTGARIENARDEKRGRDGRRVFEVDKARLVWQRSAARARPLVKRNPTKATIKAVCKQVKVKLHVAKKINPRFRIT
jgi:hypothetical protein